MKIKLLKTKYRVVKDDCKGFEVQVKVWWFPFWCQIGLDGSWTNSSYTLDRSKELIRLHKLTRGGVTVLWEEGY